jgi:hypothetical protein
MPRFIPTTKKSRRIILTLSVTLLLAFTWTNSAKFVGIAPPGYCAIASSDGTIQLSASDAQKYAKRVWAQHRSFAKESLNCTYWPTGGFGKQELNSQGLTSRAMSMWKAVRQEFGSIPYGGFGPGGITTGHMPGSAHYEGRAIDFFFKPYTSGKKKNQGWQLAQWAVMHADELNIATVIFDDRVWTRSESFRGWHFFEPQYGDKNNPIIRHLDHVHIDVF